jgi:hypothetical protein
MALSTTDATAYISGNVIDADDWLEADEAKKQRILNVAADTLTRRFPSYIIPDNAVYEFCAALAVAFNDTNKLAKQGIKSFTIDGVGSFTFKNGIPSDLTLLIPQKSYDLIGDANGVKLSRRRVGRSVR